MLAKNPLETGERIILIFKRRGPSLPIHIAKEIGLSTLFTSAFLSELLSEKRIKISYMRVGSSPLYFIPGQEGMLENFSQYLQSKEKEAFILLKEKKFLSDLEQQPAIRVALRVIKDFALPFKRNNEIFWRYFTIPESEFKIDNQAVNERGQDLQNQASKPEKEKINFSTTLADAVASRKEKISQTKSHEKTKKSHKNKKSKKTNEKFLNRIKELLVKKSIEIISIEEFSKNSLTLKVTINNKEKLLVAYNKKRIAEGDIIKANKKSLDLNLPYIIFSLGEPSKKLNNLIEAVKNLSSIEKIE